MKRNTEVIGGIPCTIAEIVGVPGRKGVTATFHAIKGVHHPGDVMKAYRLVRERAAAIHTEWSEEVPDRDDVGKNHRTGTIHGFRWVADWSTGCAVCLVTGPEYRHKQDVLTAVEDLRKYFEQRLKTVPDSLDVISHTDRRATKES